MSSNRDPDFSLFVDILHTLEEIGAPYVIIGAFDGTVYGINFATDDIFFAVDLSEEHIQRLAAYYAPPRYDHMPAERMREYMRLGIKFFIIDDERGEMTELMPVTSHAKYRTALKNRTRQLIAISGTEPFDAWCVRPEDVINLPNRRPNLTAEALPASPPPTVTRYTDITCPRRVWVIYGRIAVTVGLTVDRSQYSAAAEELRLQQAPVHVRIAAPGFQVLGQPEQQIAVLPAADSPPVVFYLHPESVGHTQVSFDFSQAGNLLGTASVPVEITDYEVDAAPEGRAGQPLHSDPGTPPADRILFVRYEHLHEQAQLIFTLQEAGAVGSEFQPVPIRGDLEMFVEKLYGAPDTLRINARRAVFTPDEADRQMRAIGRSLWRDVIPQDLRELYAREREQWCDSTLMIVSDEPYIPWELVWPYGEPGSPWQDEAPWCVTLSLTRWLRRTAQGRGNAGPPGRLSLNALASLAPTDSGLPGAQKERDMLRTLAAGHGLHDLGPDQPTWSAAIDLLEEGGYDWLHVAAHGQFYGGPAGSNSVLRLQDKRELTPQHLADPDIEGHIFRQHPGFFFNTCHGGREGWALTHLGGWAETLLSSGAGMFMAPQWQVTDSLALVFATTFYEQLLAGRTVAEAVLRARLAVRTPGDPTWLAYSIYAHPNGRLSE